MKNKNTHDISIQFIGLSGDDARIGRFLVSAGVHEKIAREFKGVISIDFFADNITGVPTSFAKIVNIMENTNYGLICQKSKIANLKIEN